MRPSTALSVVLAACVAASVAAVPIIPRVCTAPRLDQDKLLSDTHYVPDVEINSMDECKECCLTNMNCSGYQWYTTAWQLWRSSPTCYVSEKPTALKAYSQATGPVMISRCRSLDQEAADYPGFDVGNSPAMDVTDCALQCDDRDDCFAFTWATYNNGTCFMKSDRPKAVGGPFDGSVLSGMARKCREPRMDYDMTGSMVLETIKNRPHWKDCARDCKTTYACEGFSWSNYEGGTCWLKHADVLSHQFTFQKKVGVVSAVCM